MTHHSPYTRYTLTSVKEAMQDTPVIFIAGPRQSGKTTLLKTVTDASWTVINLDDQTQLQAIQHDPVGFLQSFPDTPIAIDEIQRAPELLIAIKQSVDNNRQPGRFLLTGSANALVLPQVADSLAGRIETIPLLPLSECEIHQSPASFLPNLLNGQPPYHPATIDKKNLINKLVSGYFPEPYQRQSHKRRRAWYQQYIQSLIQKDIQDLSHIDHLNKMHHLLQLSAFYSSKLINFHDIANKLDISSTTVKNYLRLLEQLFLLHYLPGWHNNAHKRLVKTPKLHLMDTGLISALLDFDEQYLFDNPEQLGFLTETFVINELQKQVAWLDQRLQLSHYRDKDKVEVDCVIETSQRNVFAIEVKSSATLTQKDFKGLRRLQTLAKQRFQTGWVLYTGRQTLPFGDNLWAVPMGALWSASS